MRPDEEPLLDIIDSYEAISQFMLTIDSYSALLKSRLDGSGMKLNFDGNQFSGKLLE
jgi:hypothetical protein